MAITDDGGRTPAGDAVAHYESLHQQHGDVPQGVGWNSDRAQRERFEQLCAVLPPADTPISVLDFGCGYGSFAEFLTARRKNATCHGYDASTLMIARARERVRDPRVHFEDDWNRVPLCDYAVASGVFNVRGSWSDERWWHYIEDTLRSIDSRTRSGWSANFLTSYSDPERKKPELYYADPLALFDWCQRNVSRLVALHHDYPLYDFTIVVRKETQ